MTSPLHVPNLLLKEVKETDWPLIIEIYFQTRRAEFAPLNLPESVLRSLLESQVNAQRADWSTRFPHSRHAIIERDSEQVGRIWTDESERSLHLLDIAVLPSFQNQGIGTAITQALKDCAWQNAKPLTLKVFCENHGAMRLYRRLGGELDEAASTETHIALMFAPR